MRSFIRRRECGVPLRDEIGLPGKPDTVGFKMREEGRGSLFAWSLVGRRRWRWRGLLRTTKTRSKQSQQREQDETPLDGSRDGTLLRTFEARTEFTKDRGQGIARPI